MTQNNQIISINNDEYLIRKTLTKLVLHHLPSLDIVHKYYSEVSFFCVNKLEIMLIYKNTLTFLKPKCPPLRLIEYQQDYLDWQPIGGLAMSNMVILYDKATIAFYYRSPKLEKSWSIDVIQEIQQVKHSADEKFIALKVKEPKNTIFVWDMNNMNKKPNQQIVLKQEILKWQFYGSNILLIMTENQFKICFAHQKTNQHYIQYYIPLPKKYSSFLALNQFNQTEKDSGRKSVNTIAFLLPNSCCFDLVQLYDIEKRQTKFKHSEFSPLKFHKLDKVSFSQPIAGFEYESKIHLLGQVDTGTQSFEPKCIVLNKNFELQKITQYKQHQGIGLENIQSQNGYILYMDRKQGKYKLGRFLNQNGIKNTKENSDHIQLLKEYPSENIQIVFLTKKNVLFVNKEKKVAIENLSEVQKLSQQERSKKQLQFEIEFSKFNPKLCYYIFQNKSAIFFVSGIRYFKFDLKKREMVNIGFVLKNQRAKLHEVRISTSSLVYKINEQYILIEYSTPESEEEKVVFRTIKSSDNDKIISLRKDKWAKVNLKEIVVGEGENEVASFSLQKMFKTLLQQNSYFEYDLFWTTHGGMILAIKNYLFFLQITDGQNGSEIHLIKKGHSYLHRRFSSSIKSQQRISVIDPRNLVIYTGSRIVKLGSQVESYVTQNPYEIPDTLLNRQLQMRQYFCPHHPCVVNAMLQNGWFVEIVKLMEKVYQWSQDSHHDIKTLYQIIQISDYYQKPVEVSSVEEKDEFGEVIVKKPEIRNQAKDIELLNKLCQNILSEPQKFHLSQNNPLILQNILKVIAFQLENTRSFDDFSQTVITKYRLQQNKSKPFTTMDVAFLLHSINKDEALEFLKSSDHKMEWSWIQKYSIVLWYEENVEKLKKWIEEIAMTQFRVNKDPFDCLFWYVLAGKKNLLVTLFKAQKFNSKQHDAMHTFLLRDFEDPKHKTAALKNAYALIDKKRYMHAMAFLLLADKKEECIRFAIDRLNDINLGYLIHLVTNATNNNEVNQVSRTLVEKGDVWAQHIGWFQEKKHIASYNCLLKEGLAITWEYTPQLTGFHPSVVEFSQKVKQSIPYKRELQLKNNPVIQTSPSMNFDHLNFDMNSFDMEPPTETKTQQFSTTSQITEKKEPDFYKDFYQILQELPEQEQNGFKRLLNEKSIKHYMRYHFPCLALTLVSKEENKVFFADAKRAYELEKYILAGQLSDSVVEIAQELDDIMGLLKNDIRLQSYDAFLIKLIDFRQRFQAVLKNIKINELNPPEKYEIGQLLHYSYFSEKIFTQLEPTVRSNQKIENELMKLSKTNNLGKIISGICLKVYSEMGKSLQAFKEKIFVASNQQFWTTCKQKYDKLLFKKKQKHQKLMDTFEFSLNKHIKKEKDNQHLDFNIRMPKSSTMSILLWRKIFEFLSKCDDYMKEKILELKLRLDKIVNYWVEKEYISQIETEINILIAEGVEYRLKLNVLSEQFKQKELDTIEELLKLVYSMRQLRAIQEKKNSQEINISNIKSQIDKKDKDKDKFSLNISDQKSAIQIFKNKSDGIKNFTLNINEGKGLEIVVLFKKTMRKFEVTDNLVNRDRSKDGFNLIHEDSTYVTDSIELGSERNMSSKSNLPQIQDSIKKLFNSRRILDGEDLVKKSEKYLNHIDQYLQSSEAIPHLDFNEIYSIETHSTLPIFFLGGKGLIELCRFDSVKNYNRILCPGIQEIIKIQSVGQRLYILDKEETLTCFLLDYRFVYKPIFQLKKHGIIDFTCSTPSQFGCITSNSFQFYDTLLHPKRQCTFKVQMSTPPVAISYLTSTQFVILRKHEVQIYDISKGQLMESYNIQGRGRSLYVDRARGENYSGKILIGRGDCKIKVIDLNKKTESIIKAGHMQETMDLSITLALNEPNSFDQIDIIQRVYCKSKVEQLKFFYFI